VKFVQQVTVVVDENNLLTFSGARDDRFTCNTSPAVENHSIDNNSGSNNAAI